MASQRGAQMVALIGLLVPFAASAEEVTVTTYYPSPQGAYQNLRSQDNALLAYQSGALGVGTSSPNLVAARNVKALIAIPNDPVAGACAADLLWIDDNSNGTRDTGECKRIGLSVQNSEGNVAIGAINSPAKLFVLADSTTNYDQLLYLSTPDDTPVPGDGTNDGVGIYMHSQNRDWALVGTNPSSGLYPDQTFVLYDVTAGLADPLNPARGARIMVDSSGSVGLNTGEVDPQEELHIMERPGALNTDSELLLQYSATPAPGGAGGTPAAYSLAAVNDGNFQIRTYGVGAPRIVMTPAGNVGIGTGPAAPTAKLEVAGQLKITGGTPGFNRVLTSDATGLARWAAPPGGTIMGSCTRTLNTSGASTTCTVPGARFMFLSQVTFIHSGSAATFNCNVSNQGQISDGIAPDVFATVSLPGSGIGPITCTFLGMN